MVHLRLLTGKAPSILNIRQGSKYASGIFSKFYLKLKFPAGYWIEVLR